MKILKRIFMAVMIVSLLLVPSFGSLAAEDAGYTYNVTFSTGVQGTFVDGSDQMTVKDLPAGATVFFSAQEAVKLDAASKYYVKGVRPAGRDNSEAEMAALTVTVNEDADYVVVYGIKGDQVSYTVNYQDENGNALAESDVFYGNVGDKPVVAYKYIQGYAPKMYGLTKTLSANAAENVFTFVYGTAMEGNDAVIYEEGDTVVVYVDKVITSIADRQEATADEEDAQDTEDEEDADNTDGTGEDESTGAEGGETSQDGEDSTDEEDTDDDETSDVIVDLDDEEVPLAQPEKADLSMVAAVSLIGVGIVVMIILIVLISRAKRLNRNEEKQ